MPPAKRTTVPPPADGPVTPWGRDVEILDGVQIRDKAELVERPFLIETVWFETSTRAIEYVYCQAQFENGESFTFNDSSSGVYRQIESYLASKGHKPEIGQEVPVRLVIPEGLRVSEYDVRDDRGRDKKAKTYYLTTSGKKAE
jgi:hypothetical protein